MEGSPKYSLNLSDGKKLLKGLLIACGGAALTWLAAQIPNLNLGQYSLILMPLLSALVNAGLKFVQDNS